MSVLTKPHRSPVTGNQPGSRATPTPPERPIPADVRKVVSADRLLALTLATVADLDRLPGWPPVRFPNPEGATPGALMAMLLYAYAAGWMGSDEIEEQARRDHQLAYLAAGQLPSSPTLRRFRRCFRPVVEEALADLLGRIAAAVPGAMPARPAALEAEARRRLDLAVMADTIALDY